MSNYLNYIDLEYKPSKDDLICEFFIKVKNGSELENAIGGVAAESSIGTWTTTSTTKAYMHYLAAKVFYIQKIGTNSANVKIAYPNDLFELGSIPDIMSSVAGNVFGMKDVDGLRLNDIIFPENIVKSFKGPKYGIEGIRKITGIKDRPLVGTIVKPKIGLNVKDHARVAYEAWIGGCDVVKDDENLSSQKFNKFEDRLKETMKMKRKEKLKWYKEEFEKIHDKINPKDYLSHYEFLRIRNFKLQNSSPENENHVEEVTKEAFKLAEKDDIQSSIKLLLQLEGVAIPIASTILAMKYPDKFAIIDKRVITALGKKEWLKNYLKDTQIYEEYLLLLRKRAEEGGLSLRDLERSLFEGE